MFETEMAAGSGEVFGPIGRSTIGEDALNFDVVKSVKVDGLMRSVKDALDLFVHHRQHEPQRQPLRQCSGGKLRRHA